MASWWLQCVLLLSLAALCLSNDYYALLEVARDASTRDLRKAFKRIALLKHPDKNPSNPRAHDEFVAINTAFEALKDPETRRIYDRFGEEGLKEQQQGGNQYQSYQYYQEEFGLYDNDEQIMTLTGHDFEHVVNSNARVFVNFYSPGCSHCHDLAPAWRELGTAMRGVMVIAAVNCQDSWHICQHNNIRSYPTLLLFKQGQRHIYRHPRQLEALTAFALAQLPAVGLLPKSAWVPTETEPQAGLPGLSAATWEGSATPYMGVVTCASDDGCLDDVETNKLQAMVGDVITLLLVKCKQRPSFCQEYALDTSSVQLYTSRTSPSQVFPVPETDHDDEDADNNGWYAPHLAQDLADRLLARLPQPAWATATQVATMAQGSAPEVSAVLFVAEDNARTPLDTQAQQALARMLHKVPNDIKVWLHACDTDCQQQRYITQLPSLHLYRSDGHEVFAHPTLQPDTILEWIAQGVHSRVRSFSPADFPSPVMDSEGVTVVDFFAGWCQPCQGMLPVYREASMAGSMSNVTFGSVDCAAHGQLCQSLNIHNYPTVVLYPGQDGEPVLFQGDIFDSKAFVNFVSMTLNPAAEVLDERSFAAAIQDGSTPWMFDFYAPWCQPCMQLKPMFEQAAHELRGLVKFGLIDCTQHTALCQREGVQSYPSLRLCNPAKDGQPRRCQPYRGQRHTAAIVAGALQALPSKVKGL